MGKSDSRKRLIALRQKSMAHRGLCMACQAKSSWVTSCTYTSCIKLRSAYRLDLKLGDTQGPGFCWRCISAHHVMHELRSDDTEFMYEEYTLSDLAWAEQEKLHAKEAR